jgi:N-acetylneuraminic acid mutarotase
MSGSSTVGSNGIVPGVYDTLGTPSATSVPGNCINASSWTDSRGHLWLFEGNGFDANGAQGDLNDMWEFYPSTREWTWMVDSSTESLLDYGLHGQAGVYGSIGTPAPGNIPSSRFAAVEWTDSGGNFWLFGGSGFDADGKDGFPDDLWEFNPSTNEWA